MSFNAFSVVFVASVGLGGTLSAADLHVPAQYPTIQQAIEAAVDSDHVVVAPGTYTERLDMLGKAITLRSSGGAGVTTLTAAGLPGSGSVITCDNAEPPETTIEGFTITGGHAAKGGGLYGGANARARIFDCIFTGNVAEAEGGAVYMLAGMWFERCFFVGNQAPLGGAAFIDDVPGGRATFINSIFTGNIASVSGGATASNTSRFRATYCTFSANDAPAAGAIWLDAPSVGTVNVRASIVWGNGVAPLLGPVRVNDSNIEGGWDDSNGSGGAASEGVIDTDPLFADPLGPDGLSGTLDDDYRLQSDSPCIDAGGLDFGTTPTDMLGNPRVMPFNVAQPRPDMGPFELQPTHPYWVAQEHLVVGGPGAQFDGVLVNAPQGDFVVYTTTQFDVCDLFKAEFDGQLSPLATGAGCQEQAAASGDQWVVYIDSRLGTSNIALHNTYNGATSIVIIAPSHETEPAISGNIVVYVTNRNGIRDIYWTDVRVLAEYPITIGGPASKRAPSIDGNLVAWHAFEGGTFNIYAATASFEWPHSVQVFPVATDPGYQRDPQVSDNRIAYRDQDNVVLYHHATGAKQWITNHDAIQRNIRIDGDYLAWSDNRHGAFDVYTHHLPTARTIRLTDHSADQIVTDLKGNVVIFEDNRFGLNDIRRIEFELICPLPTVIAEPEDVSVQAGSDVALTLVATGVGHLTYQWQHDDADITDGSTAHGSIVDGSTTSSLTITNVQPQDAGLYRCLATNECGSTASEAGELVVLPPPCPADFNGDGVLDRQDVADFHAAFLAGDLSADFNGDGVLDGQDLMAFRAALRAGCP